MVTENERPIDKLARYFMITVIIAIIGGICWYFSNVLIYVVVAAIVSLIGRPIMNLFKRIKIKQHSLPNWLLAIVTEVLIFVIFACIVTQLIPIMYGIIETISSNIHNSNINMNLASVTHPIQRLNNWLIDKFPYLGHNFDIEHITLNYIKNSFNFGSISSMIGSIASFVINMGVGVFSIVFISFFFINDENLLKKIVGSLFSNTYEQTAIDAIGDIENLLSRYFVGLLIEISGVGLLNFLGLLCIAQLGFTHAIGIGFMTGILNIIPYVGPWIGIATGTTLGLMLKYSAVISVGGSMNFGVFTIILIAIYFGTQIVDNFVFQPIIYSTSIKASPLEIFIVLLIAGNIGGMIGMLVAIPSYTVIRVIASRFFYNVKAIKRLIPDIEKEDKIINNSNNLF